jgi:hypothetical protein
MDRKIVIDMDKFKNFVKGFSEQHIVKVGIMGDKTQRVDAMTAVSLKSDRKDLVKWQGFKGIKSGFYNPSKGKTNAEIGAQHEFGDPANKVPMRSFLRMPLHSKIDKVLEGAKEGLESRIAKGKWKEIFERLGISAVAVILEAFDTGGFGTWKRNSPFTIERKKSSSPLIDTGQLRRSITYKVE